MPLPISYQKQPNTNNNTTSGSFVEKVNTPMNGGAPINFVSHVGEPPHMTHIAWPPTTTQPRPGGGTVPVVSVNNDDYRTDPVGTGSKYNSISTP